MPKTGVIYAVARGRNPGIYKTWADCERNVRSFSGSNFKSFRGANRLADAIAWLELSSLDTTDDPDQRDRTFIYTDGSCLHNGSPTARAGVGVYYDDGRRISFPLDKKYRQTNNVAELVAIVFVLRELVGRASMPPTTIVTDSRYSINAILNSQSNGRVFANEEIVMEARSLLLKLKDVQFLHVKAHTASNDAHTLGNSIADDLAQTAAKSCAN